MDIKPVAIEKDAEQHPALNFAFLRGAGIELIQKLAGKTWTDYNLHDPGITILEQLCFGITDLAYRTDFPIHDLLANDKGVIDYEKNSFFIKEEILITNPVTINDYRKVIIDSIDEAENVWLYPVTSEYATGTLKGLYKVVVQVTREAAEQLPSAEKEAEIAGLVRRCFVSKRNLCEDIIEDIEVLKPVQIVIEADIQIESGAVAEEVMAAVYYHLEKELNAQVHYYTEKEMLDQGYDVDGIYNGPFLKKGFIPDKELHDRKTMIDPTELIKNISQINGVLSVQKLHIVNAKSGKHNKPYKIDPSGFPMFDVKSSEQHIRLFRDNFELSIKKPVFRAVLQKIRESDDRSFITSFYNTSSKNVLKGKFRHNSLYHSIQNNFPKAYGIGQEGLRADVPARRKAQAKQLKAYLLLFEQMMANYLSQLDNINDFFSVDLDKKINNTFYVKPLYYVPDVKDLLKAFTTKYPDGSAASWEAFKKDKNNGYKLALDQISESDNNYVDRKNRLFEHFFARFNEFITPYPAQLYSTLYEPDLLSERLNAELKWKSVMLKNIAVSGADRVRATDYLETKKKQGHFDFAAKMRMLLYIAEDNTQNKLSSVMDTEHFTIEKAPQNGAKKQVIQADDADELSWLGEMPRILVDKREIRKLLEQEKLEDSDEIPNDAFLFRHQDAGFLQYALDIKNFRVGPDASNNGYIILYKSPQDAKWKIISRFASPDGATKSLKKLIGYIRNINIKSEGFYVLEHILLRPRLEAKVFGFRFIARNGQNLMDHSRWMTFNEREEVIHKLLQVLTGEEEITAQKLAPLCKINLYAPSSDAPEPDTFNTEQDNKNLFSYFRIYAARKENFLSRFEMLVKGEDDVIREDFFSLRMSVILPSWPARFQDKHFRETAENLFRLNIPAHVKVSFRWLNVTNMKNFETLHGDWRKHLSGSKNKDTLNGLREALIRLLNRTN